ncbi:hypothetical protein CapIbe_024269 [Capra ibex]
MKRLAGTVLGLLFAQVCCVRGVDVEQSPPALSLQEGASYTLQCHRLRHLLLCCTAQCSPGTCSLYSNPPWGSAPPPATVTP